MGFSLVKWLLPASAAGLLAFALHHVAGSSRPLPEPPPPAPPARAPYGDAVAGAGIVEARTENIAVGSALAGVVLEVYIPFDAVGRRVAAGTPLFRVDDRHLRAQLAAHETDLAAAEAQLAKLRAMPRPEELPPSAAKVRTAESDLALLDDYVRRETRLRARGANTEEELIQRRLARESGLHRLEQSRAEDDLLKAGAWSPDLEIARAAVAQARAKVEQDRVEIGRAVVRAPVEADVLKVDVRPGEAVSSAPGKALVLLGDAGRLHVRVDVDEDDIPRFRPGAAAVARPRGDSGRAYPLKFVRVEPYVIPKKSLTGDGSERVDTRVLQAIYSIDAGDAPVFVGQQVDAFIEATARDAGLAAR